VYRLLNKIHEVYIYVKKKQHTMNYNQGSSGIHSILYLGRGRVIMKLLNNILKTPVIVRPIHFYFDHDLKCS